MSRFQFWFIAGQLKSMGWPKTKGLINRKEFVDTIIVDGAVEFATHVCIGLGAGRPRLGVALLADTFGNKPWTKESTEGLLQDLEKGTEEIDGHPELLPWKALCADYKLAPHGSEIPWTGLGDHGILGVQTMITTKGILWGLKHEEEMRQYERQMEERRRMEAQAQAAQQE